MPEFRGFYLIMKSVINLLVFGFCVAEYGDSKKTNQRVVIVFRLANDKTETTAFLEENPSAALTVELSNLSYIIRDWPTVFS